MQLRVVALALTLCFATSARAQTASQAEQAIELGRQGLEAFRQGHYQEALARFRSADGLYHSPVFSLYMARCLVKSAKLLEAKALYQRVVREPKSQDEPALWKEARVDAARELDALSIRIPTLSIRIVNARPGPRTTQVDGSEMKPGIVELDPGPHAVEALDASGRRVKRQVTLEEGQNASITSDFGAPPPPPAPPPARRAISEPVRWPGIVALSVGAAGIGVGAVTGVLAKRDADAVLDGCTGLKCRPEDEDRASRGHTLGTVSTVSFVAGGVFAATGAALLLWPPTRSRVQLAPTVGGVMARGRF